MISAFYYQVYFRNDPHIYIVLVRLGEFGNQMERAKKKVIKEFETEDFRIEEATLKGILEQLVFTRDIVELIVI